MSNKDYWIPCALPWLLKAADQIEQQITSTLCQQLKNESAEVKWRNEGVQHGLVRWDTRTPDVIFKEGFLPKGIPLNGKPPISYGLADLWDWVINHNRSIFVSTTRTFSRGTEIIRWAPSDTTSIYEYTIYGYGGINVNPTLGDHKFKHQHEISFPGGIRPEFIYSARQYDANGTVIRVWINRDFNLLANGPRYEVPLFRIPDVLNWSVGVQITHWLGPKKYEYYQRLPTDSTALRAYEERPEPMAEPGAVTPVNPSALSSSTLIEKDVLQFALSREEPMAGPGSETTDPFLSLTPIRACLDIKSYGYPKEAWFFTDKNCARVASISDPGKDKLTAGPTIIINQWKSLKELGFTTVDAFLPTTSGAFVFSGEKYGRIAIDKQLKDTKVSGPALITVGWKSLDEVGLRHVEAILPHPARVDQAYFFVGRLYVLVQFNETSSSILDGPSVIVEKWTSVKTAGFDSVDNVLATSTVGQALFFKGTRYVLIDFVKDTVVKGTNYVCHDWASLVQAEFY